MWENETVVLVTSLKKRILGGKERVRFERIEADNAIPGFIKRLFRDRVALYMVKESPLALQTTPHFNLDISELNSIKEHSNAVLIAGASFFEKEIESVLQEALVLRLEYLIKPVTTLKKRLFAEKDSHALIHIEDLLEPFKKTMPYGDLLIQSCQAKGYTALDVQGYSQLIDSIIGKLAGSDPVSWLMKEFTILTDYLSESKGEDVSRLDGLLLKDFLSDRQQSGFAKAVGVEIRLGRNDFNSADLTVTLRRYQELKNEFDVSPDFMAEEEAVTVPEPALTVEPEMAAGTEIQPETEPAAPQESVEEEHEALDLGGDWDLPPETTEEPAPEPLPVETVEEASHTEVEAQPESEDAAPKGMRIIRRETNEESEQEAVSPKTVKAARPGIDLRPLIDGRMEKSFVKKLFGGDRDAYDSLLDKLDDAESWRVAKILIDNELFKRDVDPFSREAIKLVDLVYGRYYPEENAGGQ